MVMANYNYKVSVIMPVYGVKDYIALSVESVCKQDFEDFELILVDDESPDNSIEIAKRVLSNYSNVKYKVLSQKNKGLPGARNTGLREANGEFICYIDSDDIVTPDYLSALYKACVAHGAQAAFTEYEIVHLNNRMDNNKGDRGIKVLSCDELLYNNMLRSIRIHLCAMMISHDFINENSLYFNETLRFGEEVDYTWRMFPLLNKTCYIKSAKYKYLVRRGSLMTAQQAERVSFLLDNMHSVIKKMHSEGMLNNNRLKWVEYKIYFEKIHAFGGQSKYEDFKQLLRATSYKERFSKLYDFPDRKIAMLARIGSFNIFMLWLIFRIV